MAIEKKEIDFAKETDDVMKLVVELVKTIKEKGDYANLLDELIEAINGIDEVSAEYKSNLKAVINTVQLNVTDIAMIFIKKEDA